MAFECTVVTPEKQAFEGMVVQAIVAAHDGSMGVLTGRAPMLVKLGVGALRLDRPDGQKQYFLIDGGVAQMKGDRLVILTQEARPAEGLEVKEAEAAMAEALGKRIVDEKSFEDRQRGMERARAMRELAGK
jgi:F-type H+-transporting ATPase subunit epsilon